MMMDETATIDQSFATPGRVTDIVEMLRGDGTSLGAQADALRCKVMGDEIFLRGIIEITNHCRNDCLYCGIRRSRSLERYRIPDDEIVDACCRMTDLGVTTVVLQGGEDTAFSRERIGALVRRIKTTTPLAVTLSLGERDIDTYRFWQAQGMDRYFMRFETSHARLFKYAHPDSTFARRLFCLTALQEMGVQTGSGFLIGLPDQTIEELAADIIFCSRLCLDMIGVGPFIPHSGTPYRDACNSFEAATLCKVVSILRLLNPRSHIPATTAFDAFLPGLRLRLLQQGANIMMPNATPPAYRSRYELYPGKPGADMSVEQSVAQLRDALREIGRTIGTGPGHSVRKGTPG